MLRTRLTALTLAIATAFTAHATTLPQVVAGTAAITKAGNLTSITNSNGAVINWQTFNIGANEAVKFIQPSSSSAVLNRVLANDPSVILGSLTSNGKVWLVNPAGILVGPGARIDTAGYVASTLGVTNADFLAGKLKFGGDGALAGSIKNEGTLRTPEGGTIYLVAPQIENTGIIQTPGGEAILAAGHRVELFNTATPGVKFEVAVAMDTPLAAIRPASIVNTGRVSASSAVIEGGKVILKADLGKGTLANKGAIDATGGAGKAGGYVDTSAAYVDLNDGLVTAGKGGTWLIDPVNIELGSTTNLGATVNSGGTDTAYGTATTGTTSVLNSAALRSPRQITPSAPSIMATCLSHRARSQPHYRAAGTMTAQ